ncbi:hypothetical protein F5Y16DRAFT_383482 [Xylariaceae sp. FL0255]|nr:hypothetical protein F5Y16DRAFT_383482 [Xylariaceae sp. FL0255]
MEIDDEDVLQRFAAGSTVDYSAWPTLLPRVITRIEKIVHDEFPIPNIPPPANSSLSLLQPPDTDISDHFLAPLPSSPIEPPAGSSSSQDTNKENTPVAPPPANPPAPPPVAAPLPPGTLPPQIAHMLIEITDTLTSTFPTNPPHTIQRLAELVVSPRQHYRSLPTYLHALDRVVHVTSGLNVYPLPSIHAEAPVTLVNGGPDAIARPSPWATPGSDEALGGALLTPIPWLQSNQPAVPAASAQPPPQSSAPTQEASNDLEGEVRTESTETIEGPNGVGSIETVSVSVNGIPSIGARGVGVTQGELLRQEQRAGVVPISQLVPSHHVHSGHNSASAEQIQARIQHQQALQAQAQTDSPDSRASVTNTPSPASSATLGPEEGGEAVTTEAPAAVTPVFSAGNDEDEERPHARGPEEIGADDLGPQHASPLPLPSSTTGPGGIDLQGIDLQAAVGRKAVDVIASSSSKSHEDDKMDIEEGHPERASTPKRDAEDPLDGGSAAKKLKEDTEGFTDNSDSKSAGGEGEAGQGNNVTKPETGAAEAPEAGDGDPMDRD